MKINPLAFALLASTLAIPAAAMAAPQGPPPPGYGQGPGGWDAPPPEFRDIQRQGFHDGVEGARADYANHRRPDVRNRDEYRNPHVASELKHDYREGFRQGYDRAMHHLMQGPQ